MWGKSKNQPDPAAESAVAKPADACGRGCGCHADPGAPSQPADEFGDTGGPVGKIDPDAVASGAGAGAGDADLLGKLEAERDDWKNKFTRLMADFQNYQRRSLANEDQAREQATRSVVSSLVQVLDHFQLALMVDPAKTNAEQVIQGVSVIRDEMLKVLARHGVTAIAPKPNDEFDPARHEAIMQARAEGVQPGRVAAMLQEGFMVQDKVLRPAKVSVAPAE